ncbi:MAG: hypothetical protein M3Y91_06825 [Actinomycetota bacterium]|nr:hypothetical protein [Actinomycetota bacterium]
MTGREGGRGLAAAAGLLATIVGVPLIVTALNGAPPTTLPSWPQVVRALDQPVTDNDVLRVVAVIAWAVWLLFCVAVAIEAVAVARHRPGPSATRGGLRVPGLQGVAGTMVLAIVLALSARPAPTALLAVAPPAASPPSAAVPSDNLPRTDLSVQRARSVAPAPPAWVRYTVVRYDSPWAIAEEHLGNGLRWREIRDDLGTSLIEGHDGDDGAGPAATDTTARIIYPGQVLLLPPDATGAPGGPSPPEATGAPGAPSPPDATGAPGTPSPPDATDTSPPGAVSAVTTVWTGSAATRSAATGSAVTGPPPSGPAPAPSAPAPSALTTKPAAWAPDGARVQTSGLARIPAGRAPIVPLSELLLGAGFLASAAINVISLRRSRQAGHARRDERPPLPEPTLRRTEVALRGGRNDSLVGAAHRAVAALASDLVRAGQSPPLIEGMLAGADAVEVVLAQPADPPPPWLAAAGGRHWRMAITDIPSGAAPRQPELLPGLVPIGQETATGSEVLINLEASTVTGVSGDPETAAGLVHGAALALTGLPWARAADVILIGFGHLLATSQAHMRVASSVADISEELRSLAASSASRLHASGAEHMAAGRLAAGGDGLGPTIIVAPSPLSSDEVGILAEVCRSDTAITALIAGDIAAPRMLRTETIPFYVPDLHITVTPSVLPGSELTAVNQILSVALSGTGAGPDAAPYRELISGERGTPAATTAESVRPAPRAARDQPPPGPGSIPDAEVVVQVLGPVEICGVGDFRRPHAREVTVYLAMHPRGVAEHQLDEAIWPERHLVKATTRDPVVSSARTALGGPARMPHAQGQGTDKRYRITDRVGSDWQQFCSLHAHGRRTRSVPPLREALELVRGRPFADVGAGPGYGWLHLEGHLHHMEAEIVDAADLAAELFLDHGEPVAARWAANQGLLAGPYAERLWVRLMAVADALGEAQDVERILVEMDRRLDLEGDYDQLHPDTINAYRRYSRRTGRRRVD